MPMAYPVRNACASLKLIALVASGSSGGAQPAPETASVQIINATSIPAISLKINEQLIYKNFAQGLKSADSPTDVLKAIYEAEDTRTGLRAKSALITYEPGSNQSLVILGDFSPDALAEKLRPSGELAKNKLKEGVPNILFQVFSHKATGPPVRLRIVNGMPGRSLIFLAERREITVEPGDFAILEGQPAIAKYLAKANGEEIALLMRQERRVRNAMIIFFLANGRATFMRAFENQSVGTDQQLERE